MLDCKWVFQMFDSSGQFQLNFPVQLFSTNLYSLILFSGLFLLQFLTFNFFCNWMLIWDIHKKSIFPWEIQNVNATVSSCHPRPFWVRSQIGLLNLWSRLVCHVPTLACPCVCVCLRYCCFHILFDVSFNPQQLPVSPQQTPASLQCAPTTLPHWINREARA